MSVYTYDKTSDFISLGAGEINNNEIQEEIEANLTIKTNLEYITVEGNDVRFIFISPLLTGEETELDNIVSTYVPDPNYGTTNTSGTSILINVLSEIQPNGTNGGTFNTSDNSLGDDSKDENGNKTWIPRKLNSIKGTILFASLSNNRVTLRNGIYYIKIYAPACGVNDHQVRLRDVTNSKVIAAGTSAYVADYRVQTTSTLSTFLKIIENTTLEVQHRAQKKRNNDGLGRAVGFGNNETYTVIEIFKLV